MTAVSRRTFLSGGAALALSAATTKAQSPEASPIAAPRIGCGMNYDTGTEHARGILTRPLSDHQRFESELTAIRDQLHVTHVGIYGSRPESIVEGMRIAADLGMAIKVQTRLNFRPESQMVEDLEYVATRAEKLRASGSDIVLDVGCEYLFFADGLIEGDDFLVKLEQLNTGNVSWQEVMQRHAMLLSLLSETARQHFDGPVTYSEIPEMTYAWDTFDIIGIDLYLDSSSAQTYTATIDNLATTGKPVWVHEFGCCPWKGASKSGGMAWDIFEWENDPPTIRGDIQRDEGEQVRAIEATLKRIDVSKAERAFLHHFIEPDSPRSEDPAYDYDLAGYGIVSCWDETSPNAYASSGFWEPKEAFHSVAAWNQAIADAATSTH